LVVAVVVVIVPVELDSMVILVTKKLLLRFLFIKFL
jgi:hypothetical protein